MGTARGYKSSCVLDFETTFGADPAAPAGLIMPINSSSLKAERTKNAASTITGNRNPVQPFDGNLKVEGSVVVPVDLIAFGHWLRAMFGAPTTSGEGPYVHTFKVADSQPSLVLENKFADAAAVIAYAKYNGCKVNSWAMSVGGDGELTSELAIVGSTETVGATAYDSDASAVTLSRLQNFQAALTEGGSSLAIATAMDFTVGFGLDTEKYVIGGAGVLGDIPEGIMSVSGNLTALFQSTTLLNKAINSTESSLVVTFTSGTYSLAITFPEIQYGRSTPEISGPSGILITLPWQGYYDNNADSTSVKVVLTNSQAGSVYGGT